MESIAPFVLIHAARLRVRVWATSERQRDLHVWTDVRFDVQQPEANKVTRFFFPTERRYLCEVCSAHAKLNGQERLLSY